MDLIRILRDLQGHDTAIKEAMKASPSLPDRIGNTTSFALENPQLKALKDLDLSSRLGLETYAEKLLAQESKLQELIQSPSLNIWSR